MGLLVPRRDTSKTIQLYRLSPESRAKRESETLGVGGIEIFQVADGSGWIRVVAGEMVRNGRTWSVLGPVKIC